MVKTIETLIYVVFALAGAALILYFVINALPAMDQERVEVSDDDRGVFGTCDNESIVCTIGNEDKRRCEVQLADIASHAACP